MVPIKQYYASHNKGEDTELAQLGTTAADSVDDNFMLTHKSLKDQVKEGLSWHIGSSNIKLAVI